MSAWLEIGTNIACVVVATCVWVLIIAWIHDFFHRFLSKNVADNNRRVSQLQDTITDQQKQIDDMKRELEEVKQKLNQ